MSTKEIRKVEIIQAVMDRRINIDEASELLNRSDRQVYRMLDRSRNQGMVGLIHGNKGKPSPRRIPEPIRKQVIGLSQTTYQDVNDTHLQELLAEREKITISRQSLQRILRGAGLSPKRKRRKGKYHSRRQRKEAEGMMIQIDGSTHDWLEGRGAPMTLIAGRDDATNRVWARFERSECLWGYLNLMRMIAQDKGLPLSLYSDRHTIFFSTRKPTIEEQLAGKRPLTKFGEIMETLGIHMRPAYSPQAKGRIENLFGTLQDRLIAEMRLANISTLEDANRFLKGFLKTFNRRFMVKPKQRKSAFRDAPKTSLLNRILCIKTTRTVNNDHTVCWDKTFLQIPRKRCFQTLAKRKVEVLELYNGNVEIHWKQNILVRFTPSELKRLKLTSPLHQPQILQKVA